MKKEKKWLKFRHKIIRNLAFALLYPYCKLKYGLTVDRLKHSKGKQYLILYNHQTAADQFFIGMAFHDPVYYLASEDLFSNGLISSLLRYAVAPIPIKKQATDPRAIMNCFKVAREGGTIAISPEGNRTYSGKTEYINPAIATLAKRLKLPIAFFRIEGGYGVHPRWSDVIRKGNMHCYVSRILQPEEYAALDAGALNDLICRELFVNEATADSTFHHRKAAEYLERALYVCPDCGLSVLESHRDIIRCTQCGRSARYLPTKELQGIGSDFPFRFVNDWYEYQKETVNALAPLQWTEKPLFRDTADIYRVVVYQRKYRLHKNANILLYGDRIVLDSDADTPTELKFSETRAVVVLGKNKLNVYHGDTLLQVKGGKRFNALKYVNLYYRYKNITKESDHAKFLGL